jgi:hypothetical protein
MVPFITFYPTFCPPSPDECREVWRFAPGLYRYYGVYKGTTGNDYSIKGLKDNEGDKEYEEEAGCKSHE